MTRNSLMVRLSTLAVVMAGLTLLLAPATAAAAVAGPFAPAHSATVLHLALPPLQGVTNPLCGIFNLIRPWTAGAVLLGMIVAAMGFMLRAIAPEASMQMQNAVKGVGIGLFLVGIALQPAVIGGIAAALGATGLTFTC
jgi:hypothetical protein